MAKDKAQPEEPAETGIDPEAEEITADLIEDMGTVEVTDKKGIRGGLQTIDPAFADGAMEIESRSYMPKKG